ncbi:MAG TPA: hypothetical protein VFC77_07130 [Myxococcota bacterium]|nr:hypothetical protein [Myxococcota bacterium]
MRPFPAHATLARIAALCALSLAVAACAKPGASAPAAPAAPAIRSVLVFPLNIVAPMPTGLESGAASVSEALRNWLGAQGLAVAELPNAPARAAWVAAAQALREERGEQQMSFEGAASVLARTLRRERDFDALLLPWIALRPAKVKGRKVSWDGVSRTLRLVGGESKKTHFLLEDFSADAAAPSLKVAVFAGDGAELFEGVGGLDVIHAIVVSGEPPKIGEQALPAAQIFSDHATLNEGIALALAPLAKRGQP